MARQNLRHQSQGRKRQAMQYQWRLSYLNKSVTGLFNSLISASDSISTPYLFVKAVLGLVGAFVVIVILAFRNGYN
jgi:hypothetical protein